MLLSGHLFSSRALLDAGCVLTAGELGLARSLEKEKSKQDDTDAPLIAFSPNIGIGTFRTNSC